MYAARFHALLVGLSALWLSACVGIPQEILRPPPDDPQLAQVRQQPAAHVGARVRWGGQIVSVENRALHTWVVLVARPLDFSGRPKDTDQSPGRFLARFDGFLDPATYKAERELTVSGLLQAPQTRTVGDYPYLYPVLRVDASELWEPLPDYPTGFWRYPYYDPWIYPRRYPYGW